MVTKMEWCQYLTVSKKSRFVRFLAFFYRIEKAEDSFGAQEKQVLALGIHQEANLLVTTGYEGNLKVIRIPATINSLQNPMHSPYAKAGEILGKEGQNNTESMGADQVVRESLIYEEEKLDEDD